MDDYPLLNYLNQISQSQQTIYQTQEITLKRQLSLPDLTEMPYSSFKKYSSNKKINSAHNVSEEENGQSEDNDQYPTMPNLVQQTNAQQMTKQIPSSQIEQSFHYFSQVDNYMESASQSKSSSKKNEMSQEKCESYQNGKMQLEENQQLKQSDNEEKEEKHNSIQLEKQDNNCNAESKQQSNQYQIQEESVERIQEEVPIEKASQNVQQIIEARINYSQAKQSKSAKSNYTKDNENQEISYENINESPVFVQNDNRKQLSIDIYLNQNSMQRQLTQEQKQSSIPLEQNISCQQEQSSKEKSNTFIIKESQELSNGQQEQNLFRQQSKQSNQSLEISKESIPIIRTSKEKYSPQMQEYSQKLQNQSYEQILQGKGSKQSNLIQQGKQSKQSNLVLEMEQEKGSKYSNLALEMEQEKESKQSNLALEMQQGKVSKQSNLALEMQQGTESKQQNQNEQKELKNQILQGKASKQSKQSKQSNQSLSKQDKLKQIIAESEMNEQQIRKLQGQDLQNQEQENDGEISKISKNISPVSYQLSISPDEHSSKNKDKQEIKQEIKSEIKQDPLSKQGLQSPLQNQSMHSFETKGEYQQRNSIQSSSMKAEPRRSLIEETKQLVNVSKALLKRVFEEDDEQPEEFTNDKAIQANFDPILAETGTQYENNVRDVCIQTSIATTTNHTTQTKKFGQKDKAVQCAAQQVEQAIQTMKSSPKKNQIVQTEIKTRTVSVQTDECRPVQQVDSDSREEDDEEKEKEEKEQDENEIPRIMTRSRCRQKSIATPFSQNVKKQTKRSSRQRSPPKKSTKRSTPPESLQNFYNQLEIELNSKKIKPRKPRQTDKMGISSRLRSCDKKRPNNYDYELNIQNQNN